MPFVNLDGYQYSAPITWWEDEVVVVEAGHSSGFDTSITPSGPSGLERSTPFNFQGGTIGNTQYRRVLGGDFPQISGGLDYAWQLSRLGYDENEQWPDRGTSISPGGIGSATHKGARWFLTADEEDPLSAGNGVETSSGTGAFSLNPAADIFDAWSGHTFSTAFDEDPDIEAAWENALATTRPPGDGWLAFVEFPWPIFLRYEYAVDEVVPDEAIYTTDPTGTIYVGLRATGLGLADLDEDGLSTWVGPGPYSTPWVYTYGGGAGSWLTPPEDTQPSQNPTTGQLVDGADEWLILNTYIDYQSMVDDGFIIPDPSSIPSDGFDIHLGAERDQLTFAARSFWRAPQLRWGRESFGIPPRRIFGRSDGATHGAARALGGGNTVQLGKRTLGGML